MTYCYRWFTLAQELIDQDILFTKLNVQEYLEKKFLDQEPAEEEPAPEPLLDLNELD